MFSYAQEELHSEWMGAYDSVQERYASSALDPVYESYCDYAAQEEYYGRVPMSWAKYSRIENLRWAALHTSDPDLISLWNTCPPERN